MCGLEEVVATIMDRSLSEYFLLDTCVATLILNGELWKRSPAMVMHSRVDVYAA